MVRKGSKSQRVPPSDRASVAARPRRNVYIASLPLFFTDKRVRELAAPSGRIQSVSRIFNDTQTSAEVGHAYCFVCFYTEGEAAACVRRLHDMPIESRRLQVKLSKGGPGSAEPPTLPGAAGASSQPRLVSPPPTSTPTSAPPATSMAHPPQVGSAQAGGVIVADPRPPYNPLAAPPPRHVFVAHSASQPYPHQHHCHHHHHHHHHHRPHINNEAAPLNTSAGFVPQMQQPHHGYLQHYCVVPLADGHAFHNVYSAPPAAPLQYPAGTVEWVSTLPVEQLSFAQNPHTAAAPHQGPPPTLAAAVGGHAAPAPQTHHHPQAWALLPMPHQQSQNPVPRQSHGSGTVADTAFSTTPMKWVTAPDSGAKT